MPAAEAPQASQSAAEGDQPTRTRQRRLGDFVLQEELGRGGMGVVFRARQESMGRDVALKVLPSFAGMEPASVARFRREAEAAGRLSHPGIVPVYAVGEADGVHYYAMELVDGPSLDDLLERLRGRVPGRLLGSLTEESGVAHLYPSLDDAIGGADKGARYARSCAALIADIANALGVAHHNGVIHRDLKPSNAMVRQPGQAVLLDFGLARDEAAVGLTRSGDAVGTPAYMAPEQASGRKDLDARVDIYGLGATLFELLTLRPPFEGAHAPEIMRQILDQEPPRVRSLNPRVPEELENIVAKCMAKDRDQRYPAIEALEMDLRAFLSGDGVEARAPTAMARITQFARRNTRAAVVSAGTFVVAGIAAAVAGVIGSQRTHDEGLAALRSARAQLVEHADVLAAQRTLGEAEALLGADSPDLPAARREMAVEAFDRFYPRGRYELLSTFFGSLPAADRAQLADHVAKIEGRGTIETRFVPAPPESPAIVELRALVDGVLDPEWSPLPSGGVLPLGEYLLRVRVTGSPAEYRRVAIERDRANLLSIELHPEGAVPDGTVLVAHPGTGDRVAIATTELSRSQYQSFLDSIVDARLLAEMVPEGWDRADNTFDAPAAGLTLRQARAAAAHFGMHLLSPDEFALMATGGLAMPFPWGGERDLRRIAADPDQLSQPESVLGRPSGASPIGAMHALGNVAELLSPGTGSRILLAGGHYQSDPAELTLDPAGFEELGSADEANPYAGARLARFVPALDDYATASSLEARHRDLVDNFPSSIFHDWFVGDDGAISYHLMVSGVNGRESVTQRTLPVVTTGFMQVRPPQVKDGHDNTLRTDVARPSDLESARLDVQLAGATRQGQGYRMHVDSWLIPTDGLVGEGDGYVLRIPVKATGRVPTVHRVVLPLGAHVDSCDPEPSHQFTSGGQEHLVWEFLPDDRGSRAIPAVVRFRKDGPLTHRWPSKQRVDAFWQQFLQALANGDRRVLPSFLHEAYLQRPSGRDYRSMVQGGVVRGDLPSFRATQLVDFTAVGSVVTIDLTTDWTRETSERTWDVQNWPLRMQAVRIGDEYRAVRLMPKSRQDGGQILADGSYFHEGLKVRLAPMGVQLNRTQDELTEMQVTYSRDGYEGDQSVRFQVLGIRAGSIDQADQMKVWLTRGAIALRSGQTVEGSARETIGPSGASVDGEAVHWLFGGAGRFARERWTFVQKGTRHFLVKAVAEAPTVREAHQLFDESRRWFDDMARTIRIE